MIHKKEYKGVWSLPNSETSYAGTLKFDPESGSSLEIQVGFSIYMRDSPDIVVGKTDVGLVTLVECFFRKYRKSGEIIIAEYNPSYIIEGILFENERDTNFTEVEFSLLNLYDWLGISGLTNPLKNHNQSEFKITYNQPDPVGPIALGAGISLKLHPSYNAELNAPNSKIHFEQEVKGNIVYTAVKPFKEIIKDVFGIQSFVSVAVHEISYLKSLEFVKNNKRHKVLYRSPLYNIKFIHKHPGSYVLNYDDIKEIFEQTIINWFSFIKDHASIIQLLVHSLMTKGTISEDKFMDLCRALELFHRSIVKTTPRSEDDHQQKVDEILSKLSDKALRKWCKKNLMSNSHSLEARLKELHKLYGVDYIKDHLSEEDSKSTPSSDKIKQLDNFYTKVARSRNYYTHYDSRTSNNIFEKGGLYQPIKSLHVLLVSCIYQHVGIRKNLFDDHFNDATID